MEVLKRLYLIMVQHLRVNTLKGFYNKWNWNITSAPYHPSTNGLAERAVQTMKQGVCQMEGESVEESIKIFAKYRITPHSTTGTTPPSELLMGHKLGCRFGFILS